MEKTLFFEPITQQYFYSSVEKVNDAKASYNLRIIQNCFEYFSTFLSELQNSSPDVFIPDIANLIVNTIDNPLEFILAPYSTHNTDTIYYEIKYIRYGTPRTTTGRDITYTEDGIDCKTIREEFYKYPMWQDAIKKS